MFVIIENYKKMLLSIIKNDFSADVPSTDNQIKANDFEGDTLSDLKTLKHAISDGKIDLEEAKIIADNFEKINKDARNGLNELVNSILENGFSIKIEASKQASYDAFKKLLEKSGYAIPERSVIGKVLANYYKGGIVIQGIKIKGDKMEILFEKEYSKEKQLVVINFEGSSIIGEAHSSEVNMEGKDFKNISEVNQNLLDDNITNQLTAIEYAQRAGKVASENAAKVATEQEQAKKETAPAESASVEQAQIKPIELNPDKLKIKQKKSPKDFFDKYSAQDRKEIQRFLNVKDDGEFGPITLRAIKKFQKDNKLFIDGKVGPFTLGKLRGLNKAKKSEDSLDEIDKIFEKTPNKNIEKTSNKEKENKISDEKETNDNGVTFIGENGEKISVEYDPIKRKLFINTPYFDGVDDFYITDKKFNYREEAFLYVIDNISKIKEIYDQRVLNNPKKEKNVE